MHDPMVVGADDQVEYQLSIEQDRVLAVLERMIGLVYKDAQYASDFAYMLEKGLNDMQHEDGFGSEGSTDPRGDFRDGDWSMEYVQGVDL